MQKAMSALPKSRTHSAGIPISPPFLSGPPLPDREPLRIAGISAQKPVNRRTRRRFGPNSRLFHGRPACNRAAHKHGRFGPLPILPPALRVAWRRDADRTTERIVVWTSWARLLCPKEAHSANRPSAGSWPASATSGWLHQGKILLSAAMHEIHGAERSWKVFFVVLDP